MTQRDPFQVLGIPPGTATSSEVQRAYRGLARQYHPDVNQSEEAAARMRDINWARDQLQSDETIDLWRQRVDPASRRGRGNGRRPSAAWDPTRPRKAATVTVEPMALVLVAKQGASALFTVRAYGVPAAEIRCRFTSRVIQLTRRASEFGHASFVVTSLGVDPDREPPYEEIIEVWVRSQLAFRLPVRVEPEPQPSRRRRKTATAEDTPLKLTVTPATVRLPGVQGCQQSFEVAAVGLGGDAVVARVTSRHISVSRTFEDEAVARFTVEVLRDIPPDQEAGITEHILLVAEGRAPTRVPVILDQPASVRRRAREGKATPAISFGKYAGTSFERLAETDPGYLRWMLRTDAGTPDDREAARDALRRFGP